MLVSAQFLCAISKHPIPIAGRDLSFLYSFWQQNSSKSDPHCSNLVVCFSNILVCFEHDSFNISWHVFDYLFDILWLCFEHFANSCLNSMLDNIPIKNNIYLNRLLNIFVEEEIGHLFKQVFERFFVGHSFGQHVGHLIW